MSGCFITFEGIEKSGKTTQAKLLAERLKAEGYQVLLTHEPGGTPIGEDIRAVVLNIIHSEMCPLAELFLFMASRAQHVEEVVRPHLDRGGVVLCDRFSDSTLAYQGYGRGIPLNTIEELNRIAVSGCQPDLTILLDIPIEVWFEREGRMSSVPDRIENDRGPAQLSLFRVEFPDKVREGFLRLAESHGDRIHVIDGSKDIEENERAIYPIVKERLAGLKMGR
jgi:dTMP kinase